MKAFLRRVKHKLSVQKTEFLLLHTSFPRRKVQGKSVMFMIYSAYGGGAERVACLLASGFAEKYPVTLVCCEDKGRTYPLGSNVEVVYLPHFWDTEEQHERLLERYVRKLKRSRKVFASVSLMYTMNRLNVLTKGKEKVICSERNNPARREPEHMAEIASMYARADHVVFQSKIVRDLFGDTVKSHCTILPNPVSVECPRSTETRHRIVNVGRLNPQKNQMLLIRAFAVFSKKHPEYTLSFYGDGDMKKELEEETVSLGVERQVFFHGNSGHIHREIADAEMFVLSSNFEGLSNALLECMMMGMSCISTSCEGSVDVIRDGENGLLVETGSEEQLCQAMTRLADDPELRDKLGTAAARDAGRFRKETVVREWMELAEQL